MARQGRIFVHPARLALTRIGVLAVALSAPMRAVWHVTDSALPAVVAHAKIRGDCYSMEARGVTDSLCAVGPCPAIEAHAVLRALAESIDTIGADSKVALLPLPAFVADAIVWRNTVAVEATARLVPGPIGVANGNAAVDSGPAFFALAALPFGSGVLLEAVREVSEAARRFDHVLISLRIEEFVGAHGVCARR